MLNRVFRGLSGYGESPWFLDVAMLGFTWARCCSVGIAGLVHGVVGGF